MTPLLLALLAAAPVGAADDPARLHVRGGLPGLQWALKSGEPVRLAFLGGSITERDGFRPLVESGLRARFPEATWEFRNAGIASTGSTTGAFRFDRDVLAAWEDPTVRDGFPAPPPVLVIAEFAVNDDQDERLPAADAGWGMESIVRQTTTGRATFYQEEFGLPRPDLLFVHFPNPSIIEAMRAGGTPASVAAHERVAQHYAVPSVSVAAEVARRIEAGSLTWDEYGGTHPGPIGNELAADLVIDAIVRGAAAVAPGEAALDRSTIVPLRTDVPNFAAFTSGFGAAFFGATRVGADWRFDVPLWENLPGECRPRFRGTPLLHTETPGSTLTFPVDDQTPFTALALYVLAGPDAGAVDVRIGDGEPRRIELYHPFSENLHYPRTVLLYRGAEPPGGPVTVTTAEGERSGTAVRIVGVGVGAKRVAE